MRRVDARKLSNWSFFSRNALAMELSGYVFSPLREGDFTLCRGCGNGLAPILLVTAKDTSLASLERLEHENALKRELDVAWAARPIELCRYNDRLTLVLEDPGGEPLDRQLGRLLEVTEFLRIAIPLAGALRRVHARGLIHKDIKPANVLVNVASGDVWLTGFGIAVHVPRERLGPEAPAVIAGTLAYMAPEQTGRMNRSIDARSDLYSLGITFYQMLTGSLPFSATDPMEWVHCHIARQPTPPDERAAIPGPIAAIVMKLLSKTAEERYQTAAGVEADLRKCLAAWGSGARIDPFPLATQDASDRLLIPERLYGREHEIEALLASFERIVADGTPELVLVSGYSGVGKSSVVHELQKVLVPPRGLFASGKFDQYQRDIPYATLAQAFKSLVRSLLGRSEAELRSWRDALREALGSNGELIVNLIPELELVIGPQRPVPNLPPQDAQNRFRRVFTQFLDVFARREHPLVLFLDDLQWLDAATLDLLEHVITCAEVQHLLLVGAYRDNEVGPSHPLMSTLDAIRSTGARVHEIMLAPLGLDDVSRLVADCLHCECAHARPLAKLMREKTGGNPFFAIQFFSALAEEKLLVFDPATRAWQWDINRIRAHTYSDNVVDLMAEKLKRLSASTQEALKQFACLGNVAAVDILTLFHGETEATTHAALREAVHAGLLFRLDSAYTFLHDRIQQAAYSLIPEERRAEVHLALGRVLRSRTNASELAERLFDVANQFNRGAARLVDREEKAQVATINLRAGRKAKASAAYASACAYFSAGITLLEDQDWGSQHELTFSLWLERAQCELLTGQFDKAAQLIRELLQRAASNVEFADASCLKVQLHVVMGEYPQAVRGALTCARLFDIDLPAHPTFEQVRAEYEKLHQTLNERTIESLIELPMMTTDPELHAAMQVLSVLASPAYFTDFHLFCLFACRMVRISMQHGMSGAAAHGCAVVGFILGPFFHRYDEGYRFAKLACDLVEKHGFVAYEAKVNYAMGTVAFWTQPTSSAIDSMRATFRSAIETGDLTFACYGLFQSITGLLLRNDPLDAVWRESEVALDFAWRAKYGDAVDIIRSQQHFVATMQGRTARVSTFSDAQIDEATFESQLTGDRMTLMICWYWILKLKLRFLSGDHAAALAAADKAKPLLPAAAAQIQLLDYFFYAALTVTALFETASDDEQTGWRELLTMHREQLREWSDNCPRTFGDKHALVSAEIARIEGRDTEAMRLYEQAIESTLENGFIQNEGLAHELAAGFFLSRGSHTAGRAHLEAARNCFARWGAHGKIRQLEQLHPYLREKPIPASSTATFGAPAEQLDVSTVIKASQAVSSEIEVGRLIETLMRIAIEHAGAERGLLIFLPSQGPQIEAEAMTIHGSVAVTLRQAAAVPAELPESVLNYMIRTRESVVLDDATKSTLSSADAYVLQRRPRSVLCLPLVKQAKLVGALYLENNLTPCAFTADRIAVLELLASQAAISLENARLYSDLQRSEAYLAEAQRLSQTGSFGWDVSSGEVIWSEESFRIFQYDPTTKPTIEAVLQRIHPEDTSLVKQVIGAAAQDGRALDYEHRLLMPDGSVKHIHVVAHALKARLGEIKYVGAIMDVTLRTLAAQALRVSEHLARGQLDALATAVTAISTESKPEKFLEHVLYMICGQLGAHSMRVGEMHGSSGLLDIVASYQDGHLQLPTLEQIQVNPPMDVTQGIHPAWSELIAGGTEDAASPIVSILLGPVSTLSIVAAVCITIPLADRATMFFGIRFTERRAFQPEDVVLAQALAHQATLAIRLMRLSHQSREAAVVAERIRMARDIHDTLAQGLTGVIVQMEVARSALARQDFVDVGHRVERAKELARANLREARRSVLALRPRSLQGKTLDGALHVLLEQMTDGVPLTATCEIAGEEREIPSEWEEELLRITQEALTNATKHADARNFKAILTYGLQQIQLQLIDDGVGFDLEREYKGFGLIGMRERVDRMSGRLMIRSTPGSGTEIRIIVRDSAAR
jgi:predicted ATPase/signal transduction histidine kinase